MRDKLIPLLLVLILAAISKGDEPWKRHTIDNTFKGADGVRLGDFNGDHLLDVVTGWEESGVVRLYLHPGYEKSKQPWPAVTVGKGKSPEDAVPMDVDGDGRLEVVSCHEGKLKQVLVHRYKQNTVNDKPLFDQQILNDKNWETIPLAKLDRQQWMFAAPIVLNQGLPALVLGSKNDNASITLLHGDKSGAPIETWIPIKLRSAGWIMSIQILDMDADGDSDIVLSDRKGKLRGIFWLEQPNSTSPKSKPSARAAWKEHAIGGSGNETLFIEATPNRILASTRNSVWLEYRNTPTGKWSVASRSNPKHVVNGKAIRSFQDGSIVLTANTQAAKTPTPLPGIWLKRPDQPWQVIDETTKAKFDRMELIDLDGDGDLDIMTCEERRQLGVVWYENPQK